MSAEDRNMTLSKRSLRRAALWRIRLQYADFTPELHERWEAWIEVPANEQAFARVEGLWDRFAWQYSERQQDDAQLDAASTPLQKPTGARRGTPGIGLHSPPDIVAGSLAAFALSVVLVSDIAPATTVLQMQVQPTLGEALEHTPALGTAPLTDIEVSFDGQQRIVHIERGKAVFRVSKDPQHRFVVSAGSLRIEGAGTEFSVSNNEQSVVVMVLKK